MLSYDYSYLEKLLVAQQWKEADEETCHKLVEVIRVELEHGRLSDEWLLLEDLPNEDKSKKFDILIRGFGKLNQNVLAGFPLSELINLDQLWRNYSDDWFGYSPQLEVWKSLGGRETPYELFENQEEANRISELFRQELGWEDTKYDFKDSRLRPKGHLPSYPGPRGGGVGFSPFYITSAKRLK